MATLFRCPTPTDLLCPCGRVARALRRAGVPVEEVRLPYRRSRRELIEAITGQRRLPVVEIDGEAICDSRRIVEYLAARSRSGSAAPGGDYSRADGAADPPRGGG